MSVAGSTLKERFEGCLFGLAVGDALGGKFEAQSADAIRARFPSAGDLIAYPQEEIWYTDDTQMAIGVAEALVERGEIAEDVLCRAFVANYVPSRGYGRGARAVLDAMEDGRDYRAVAEQLFPGGSLGNGAAMRVAPVGLVFRDDRARLWEQARRSALPTHLHPLGIEGAQLLALAIALCSAMEEFDRAGFFAALLAACASAEYRGKLEEAARVQSPVDLAALGNRIEALHSVPTAIASFALTPESFETAVCNVIFLGGDTDTLAAMAGALSGAYLGVGRLPGRPVGEQPQGPGVHPATHRAVVRHVPARGGGHWPGRRVIRARAQSPSALEFPLVALFVEAAADHAGVGALRQQEAAQDAEAVADLPLLPLLEREGNEVRVARGGAPARSWTPLVLVWQSTPRYCESGWW